MVLYLQWWGSYPETKEMDKIFFLSLDTSKKILYIPTAMVWGYTYEDCYNYILHITQSLWLSIEIASFPYLDELIDVDFSQYGWIYIWWGNTFKLLYEIQRNWMEKKIIDFLENWWLVCWWSAWSIIFWRNINTAADANILGLQNVLWLNMICWVSIWCHYTEEQEDQIKEYIKQSWIDVIALPETAGIKVNNNDIIVIGEGNVVWYKQSDRSVFWSGEHIKIVD